MKTTNPPERIVAAVDFGEASARAIQVAAALAQKFGASLEALHVESLAAPPYFTIGQVEALEGQRKQARAAAERYLAKWVRDHLAPRAGHPGVAVRIADGTASAEILRAAANADLLVMGTHGHRGPTRWWMGSVAERVVREAVTPVVVVHAADRDADPAAIFERLLVIGPFAAPEGLARRYAHTIGGAFGTTAVDGTDRCSIETVQQVSASMLVIPTHSGERQWLGEQAEKILRRCTLPILFVPETGGVRREAPAQVHT